MSVIFRQVKSDTEEVSMLDFINRVEPNQEADKAFQANEFTRWKEEQGASYMTSTITNMAPSKFIFCDVQKCLESDNRTINIIGFIDGTFGIEEGTYEIGDSHIKIKKDLNDKLYFDREKNE